MDDEESYDPARYARNWSGQDSSEKAALLPGLNSEYKAAGFVDNEVPRLALIMGKDGFRIGSVAYHSFQYMHIGSGEFGFTANGQMFHFVVSDLEPKRVTVHGRNLLRIFDCIGLRRMQWIRQTDRDFRLVGDAADNEPVITRIEVSDWKRPEVEKAAPARDMTDDPA